MLSVMSWYGPYTSGVGTSTTIGRKRVYSHTEEPASHKKPNTSCIGDPAALIFAERAKYEAFRIRSFRAMCRRHEEFLYNSTVIDGYLLALASLYMKRAALNERGYSKDRYFFYALYLAVETEEDLPLGAEEILLYLLGPAPNAEGCSDKAALQVEWDKRLSRFLSGKDKFWARLGYRTWMTVEKCKREIERFPPHDEFLRRRRTHEEMASW